MRHLQLQKYLSLPQSGKVIAEYVWIDGSNGIRSKSKVSISISPVGSFLHQAPRRHLRRQQIAFRVIFRAVSLPSYAAAMCTKIHILVCIQHLGVACVGRHLV